MGKHVLATFIDPDAVSDAESMRVEVETASGHRLITDGRYGAGGPGPTELVLAGLASCTSMDVASILRKKRQRVATYQIAVDAEQAEDHPHVFTRIVVEHRVAGDVQAEALRRSIELSATRYCPVSAMLSWGARIEHRYRLDRPDGEPLEALVMVTGPDVAPADEADASPEALTAAND
jgi:putative redox protein